MEKDKWDDRLVKELLRLKREIEQKEYRIKELQEETKKYLFEIHSHKNIVARTHDLKDDFVAVLIRIRGVLVDWENTFSDQVRNRNKFIDLYKRIDSALAPELPVITEEEWLSKLINRSDGSNIG